MATLAWPCAFTWAAKKGKILIRSSRRRLCAVLTNLEAFRVLDGLAFLFAQQFDELGTEAVGQPRVAPRGPLSGPFQPGGLVLGDITKIAEQPGVPLVELRL